MAAFDFFRKYQKAILYTAGFFALITFSITTALTSFFENLFTRGGPSATVTVPDGRAVTITNQDSDIGMRLFNVFVMSAGRGIPIPVMPLFLGEDDRQHGSEILAAVRRLAIESGIEYSEAEAREAIAQTIKLDGRPDLTEFKLAQLHGFTSAGPFRAIVGEALRVSTYLRLAALSVDLTDAELVASLVKNRELVTLKDASLDKRALETELKKTPVTDEELQKWLAGLGEKEQEPFRHTSNKVALTATGLVHTEFDPGQWTEELQGKEYGDEVLNQRYMLDREIRWRKPKADDKPGGDGKQEDPKKDEPNKGEKKNGPNVGADVASGDPQDPASRQTPPASAPQSDAVTPVGPPAATQPEVPASQATSAPVDPYRPFAEVKDLIKKTLQAEDVMRSLSTKVQEQLAAHTKEMSAARDLAAEEHAKAKTALDEAEQKLKTGPETDELKKAVADAKTALEAKEQAKKAAEQALVEHRKKFKADEAFLALAKGRAGMKTFTIPEPQHGDGLKNLGELGTWTDTWVATSMDTEGDLGTLVKSTDKASILWQLGSVEKRPLKDFAQMKTELEAAYWKQRADESAKTKTKTFEDALLRLAKDVRKTEIQALEGEKVRGLDERLTEWRKTTQQKLDEARTTLQGLKDTASQGYKAWSKLAADLEGMLAKETEQKAAIEKTLNAEVDAKIKAEARKAWPEVIEPAATEAGFKVSVVGPYHRELYKEPRFNERFDETVRFLFAENQKPILEADPKDEQATKEYNEAKAIRLRKPGEATVLLEDKTNRTLHLAVVTKVEPATTDALTRRDLITARDQFVQERLMKTVEQSFSMKALEIRDKYERPGKGSEAAQAPK